MAKVVNDQEEKKETENSDDDFDYVTALGSFDTINVTEIQHENGKQFQRQQTSVLYAEPPKCPSQTVKTGILYKKGGITGALYNPRYFELRDNGQLNYYEVDGNGKRVKKGGIILSASTKIEKREGGTRRNSKFIIHHPLEGKEWYLWCHSVSGSNAIESQNEQNDAKNGENATSSIDCFSSDSELENISDSELQSILEGDNEIGSNQKKDKFTDSNLPTNEKENAERDEWCRVLNEVIMNCITTQFVLEEMVSSNESTVEPDLQ